MKISGQLDWKDYLKAQRLHMRPSRPQLVILYITLGLILVAILAYINLAALGGDVPQAWSWLWPVAVIGGVLLLYYYVLLP